MTLNNYIQSLLSEDHYLQTEFVKHYRVLTAHRMPKPCLIPADYSWLCPTDHIISYLLVLDQFIQHPDYTCVATNILINEHRKHTILDQMGEIPNTTISNIAFWNDHIWGYATYSELAEGTNQYWPKEAFRTIVNYPTYQELERIQPDKLWYLLIRPAEVKPL